MKYLNQFLIILGFTLLGEVLQRIVPLPIPASVYGIVFPFLSLCFGLVKLEQVKEAGGFLTSILPVLLVAPAVGILENWGLIKTALVPMVILVLADPILPSKNNFVKALRKEHPEITTVVQIAPAVRTAWGEALGLRRRLPPSTNWQGL
jgi:holin-like protein